MDQYIGKFLDNRYELLEVIGTGGMAVVYKARCHRLNRLVAVKVLKADLAQDAEFRRRFHDESQAVAMLSHPNIVAVYDVSHSDDLDYIVMELIDGITLKQYVQKRGPVLNWREALHFITQIMRALSHAHSRGIIHRDIKPHNVMVLRDGSVKVSDFGIARITSAHQSTLTQEALGSVHYISPEQARGSHIDARSDIYSAGVVLYEMITGRLPFEGESPVAVAIQHINSIPLSPRELNPEIPEALEEITMKAMAPNPDERYLSADEMLADLEEFRKNPNINFDYNMEDLKTGDEPTRPVPVGPIHETGAEPPQARARKSEVEDVDDYEDRDPAWPIWLAAGAILVFIIGIVVFLVVLFSSGGGDGDREQGALPIPSSDTSESPDPDGEEVEIPANIINAELRVARYRLDQLGIEYDEVEDYSDSITVGRVIKTIPDVGETVKKGERITLVTSKGPQVRQVTMIDLTGKTEREAVRQLQAMDLELGEVTQAPSDQPEGQVIGQSVANLTEVPEGTAVDLVISSGPEASPSPSPSPEPSHAGQPSGIPVESPEPPASQSPASQPPASEPPASEPPASEAPVQPPMKQKAVFVHQPSGMEDKSSLRVRIEVDGQVVHDESHEALEFPISPLVPGRGTQQVSVYVDGVLEEQYMLTFSS